MRQETTKSVQVFAKCADGSQDRDYDTYDGPGYPVGRGATEQEAINDLLEKLK
jgi:hypothetical protein